MNPGLTWPGFIVPTFLGGVVNLDIEQLPVLVGVGSKHPFLSGHVVLRSQPEIDTSFIFHTISEDFSVLFLWGLL